jgi:hypothetical protein
MKNRKEVNKAEKSKNRMVGFADLLFEREIAFILKGFGVSKKLQTLLLFIRRKKINKWI